MKEGKTNSGKQYVVTTANGCTVTTEDGLKLAEIEAGKQGSFIAIDGKVLLSDDSARLTPVFNAAPIAAGTGGGGGSVLSASGEPVVALSGGNLTVKHATWYDNAEQGSIAVLPAAWQNEVMTCYLKTSVPVTLSGVNWLYGEPTMAEGYTYVIALQQIDAATVLANLAYVLPQ